MFKFRTVIAERERCIIREGRVRFLKSWIFLSCTTDKRGDTGSLFKV